MNFKKKDSYFLGKSDTNGRKKNIFDNQNLLQVFKVHKGQYNGTKTELEVG